MSRSGRATFGASLEQIFGLELYEAALAAKVRLSDPRACEAHLKASRAERLNLNDVAAGRRIAIDLVQRTARGAKLPDGITPSR